MAKNKKKKPIIAYAEATTPGARPHTTLNVLLRPAVAAVVIIAAALLAYHNSFTAPLIFDDYMNLRDNASIRRLWPPATPLRPPVRTGVSGRPLVNLSFAIDYAVGGLKVTGYHVVNFVIHAATALALFGVVRRTLLQPRLAGTFGGNSPQAATGLGLLVATLWVVHPLLTDSVSYLSGRTELLVGLFMLLSLYCFIRGATVLAVIAGVLAACCKEVVVALPLLILLYDRTFLTGTFREAIRRSALFYAGLTVTVFTMLLLNLWMADFHRVSIRGSDSLSTWTYLKMQAEILVMYLRLSFWPHPLILDYLGWRTDATLVQVLPSALLIVGLLAFVVYGVARGKPLAYPGAWFFLILAPTSSFLPLATEPATERRMYLPLMAVVAVVVLAGAVLVRRLRIGQGVGVVLCVLVIGAAAFRTVARNEDYQDPVALWADVAARRPNPARAYINLGQEFLRRNQPTEAKLCFLKAVQLDETDYTSRNNLAALLRFEGNSAEAERYLRESLAINPNYDLPYQNLGIIYFKRGDLARAEQYLRDAVRLNPDRSENQQLLSKVVAARGGGAHSGGAPPR